MYLSTHMSVYESLLTTSTYLRVEEFVAPQVAVLLVDVDVLQEVADEVRQTKRRARLRRELLLGAERHVTGQHEVVGLELLAVLLRHALPQRDDIEHARVAVLVERLPLLATGSSRALVARGKDPLTLDGEHWRRIAADDSLLHVAERLFLQADDPQEALSSFEDVGLPAGDRRQWCLVLIAEVPSQADQTAGVLEVGGLRHGSLLPPVETVARAV